MISIVSCCFASIAVPSQDIANRLTVSMTLLLVIVAFKFVIASLLPPINYMTWLDYYVMFNVLIIASFVLENTIANSVQNNIDLYFGITIAIVIFCTNCFMILASCTNHFRLSWEIMDIKDRDNEADDFMSAEINNILDNQSVSKKIN